MAKPKRPRDVNERAVNIARILTGEIEDNNPDKDKNPHAVALGRLGGLKGGPQRAKNLTAKKRKEISKKALDTRWKKNK